MSRNYLIPSKEDVAKAAAKLCAPMTLDQMQNDSQLRDGAYRIWLRYYRRVFISERMQPFFKAIQLANQVQPPDYLTYKEHINISGSWLRMVRQSLFLSGVGLSKKMNLQRGAFNYLEGNEVKGVITLNNLRKAAEAMDCELVYAIIPKNKVTPAEQVWEKLYPTACKAKMPTHMNISKPQRMQIIAKAAQQLMEDETFRTQQGWSAQNEVSESGVFREITQREAKKLQAPTEKAR